MAYSIEAKLEPIKKYAYGRDFGELIAALSQEYKDTLSSLVARLNKRGRHAGTRKENLLPGNIKHILDVHERAYETLSLEDADRKKLRTVQARADKEFRKLFHEGRADKELQKHFHNMPIEIAERLLEEKGFGGEELKKYADVLYLAFTILSLHNRVEFLEKLHEGTRELARGEMAAGRKLSPDYYWS